MDEAAKSFKRTPPQRSAVTQMSDRKPGRRQPLEGVDEPDHDRGEEAVREERDGDLPKRRGSVEQA